MNSFSNLISRLVIVIGVLCCSVVQASLPKILTQELAKYKIPSSSVSAYVVALGNTSSDRAPVLSHQAQIARNPASVIKLLTTLSALETLGPAHTWTTNYYINGKLKKGVLKGDLIMKGNGDPYLVKEEFWLHLIGLREQGLQSIEGDFLIDNSAFNIAEHDPSAFDKQPTRLYNVGPSATLANFNASRFQFKPEHNKIIITQDPPLENITVINHVKAAKGRCQSSRQGWSYDVKQGRQSAVVTFSGSYNSQCGQFDFLRSVLDANSYLYGLFRYLWRSLGGEFSGDVGSVKVGAQQEPFLIGGSRTLAQVIKGINKHSNNLLARQLLLSMGAKHVGRGATIADSVGAVSLWLDKYKLLFPELVLENGSGLSRKTRISAQHLNQLLVHGANSLFAPEFMASFALGGIDGSMKKRRYQADVGARLRMKTGYLSGVRTLAGYIRARNGENYAVVLMIQSPRVNYSNGNQIQDVFIRWVLNI